MKGFVGVTDQDVNPPHTVPGNPGMRSYQDREMGYYCLKKQMNNL